MLLASNNVVIGHCRDGNEDVLFRDVLHHGGMHVLRSLHVYPTNTAWHRQGRTPRYQKHLGTGLRRGLCHRIAHLSGTDICNAANRINRLKGRPGSDQHLLAGESPCPARTGQLRGNEFKDLFRFKHSSQASFATGLITHGRP